MLPNARRYLQWVQRNELDLPCPDADGFFRVGHARYLMPVLRCWYGRGEEKVSAPEWQTESWRPVAGGWARYLRADQALAWASTMHQPRKRADGLRWLVLHRWLVGVEHPLQLRPELLAGKVEAIRVRVSGGKLSWYRDRHITPAARDHQPGLDPVHTPESRRAGYSRHLASGAEIDDQGEIAFNDAAGSWGPGSRLNLHRLHVAPRRLMLGAGIACKAVPTGGDLDLPPGVIEGPGPGASFGESLQVILSTMGGWTHEDAVVVSRSAAARMTRHEVVQQQVRLPLVAGRVELAQPGDVGPGDRFVRAWIDGYALGIRKGFDPALDQDGWCELFLPGAEVPAGGELLQVQLEPQRGLRWRGSAVATIKLVRPLSLGDKLATHHGIKGVVSAILPDHEMPLVGDDPQRQADVALGPMGIEKRGALGQLHELGVQRPAPSGTHWGQAQLLRMPNDACDTGRARGAAGRGRGLRFGEMEFWALMAHNTPDITAELLHESRCTSAWLRMERRCGAANARAAASQALSRYLANACLFDGERTRWPRISGCGINLQAEAPSAKEVDGKQLLGLLDQQDAFVPHGQLVVPLKSPLEFALGSGTAKQQLRLRLHRLYILPPWLRPDVDGSTHPLTSAYQRVGVAMLSGRDLEREVRGLVDLSLEQGDGIGGFLKAHVLGRRLNRSARAVAIPDPGLRIDQVGLPPAFMDELFGGLEPWARELVLVNRTPTLHRYGLLALRPVANTVEDPVIRLPLGLLTALGADFDGDTVRVVALTTAAAQDQAQLLLPGAPQLRRDPYRPRAPAVFRFSRELAEAEQEDQLAGVAQQTGADQWAAQHAALQARLIGQAADRGLPLLAAAIAAGDREQPGPRPAPADLSDTQLLHQLWQGMDQARWLERAEAEMQQVFRAEDHKGKYGGILRRYLYRLPWAGDAEQFCRAVGALQAFTERLTQSALSVKSGSGAAVFDYQSFLKDPQHAEQLELLDPTLDRGRLAADLGQSAKPAGLLAWMAVRSSARLLATLRELMQGEAQEAILGDPRLTWFLE